MPPPSLHRPVTASILATFIVSFMGGLTAPARAQQPYPDIIVQQPVGRGQTDGASTVYFASNYAGALATTRTFTIKNTGVADLTDLAVTVDGTHAADFAAGTLEATTLAAGETTTFPVAFTPSASGVRSATLHIASNVAGAKNPFDIVLTSAGANSLQNPGFESTTTYINAPSWSRDTWNGALATTSKDTTEFHSGLASQRFTVTDFGTGGTLLKQSFSADAGAVYEARIWMKGTPGQIVQFLLRQPTNYYRAGATHSVALTSGWQEYVIRGGFQVAADAQFVIQPKTMGTFYVDDASLADVTATVLPLQLDTTTPVTPEYFGLHINKLGTHNVWPALNQGLVRLWDTATMWQYVQPTSTSWNFSRLDYYVTHIRSNNPDCAILYTMGTPPLWATGGASPSPYYGGTGSTAPPTDMEDWRTYVRTIGQRYVGKIKFYELWNEWDYGGFYSGSITAMVTMAQIAREELRAIDPEIQIISPNITANGLDTLDRFLAAGGGDYIDIVSHHAYAGRRPEAQLGYLIGLRDVLSRHPSVAGKPLWNTEGSAGTSGGDDVDQGLVARDLLFLWLTGVRQFGWYGWDVTPGGLRLSVTDTGPDLAPGGVAYREVRDWLVGAKTTAHEITPQGVWQVALERGTTYQGWALWTTDFQAQSFDVPMAWRPYRIRTLDGTVSAFSAAPTMVVNETPVLLEPQTSFQPEIGVEQPTGSDLAAGSARVDFGTVRVATTGPSLTFTLRNHGAADLTGINFTSTGTHSADFTVGSLGTSTVVPGGTTTFAVTFNPAASGPREAVLHIHSNAAGGTQPFDLTLAGDGVTAAMLFASTASTAGLTGDDALPQAQPFGDGVENLLKYAFNMDLSGPDIRRMASGGAGGLPAISRQGSGAASVLRIEFLQRRDSGLLYQPQISSELAPLTWNPPTAIPTVTPIDTDWERVVYEEPYDPNTTPRLFGRVKVALP